MNDHFENSSNIRIRFRDSQEFIQMRREFKIVRIEPSMHGKTGACFARKSHNEGHPRSNVESPPLDAAFMECRFRNSCESFGKMFFLFLPTILLRI